MLFRSSTEKKLWSFFHTIYTFWAPCLNGVNQEPYNKEINVYMYLRHRNTDSSICLDLNPHLLSIPGSRMIVAHQWYWNSHSAMSGISREYHL